MLSKLIDDGYYVLPGFISPERAEKMAEEFIFWDKQDKYESDLKEAPAAAGLYNPIGAVELLCEKTKDLSYIVGETVLPTYAFGRMYRNGDRLNLHTDRVACEISITLHLRGDQPWQFGANDKWFDQRPGDAILYLGCITPHSRKGPFTGTEYVQFFLHYVRSRGVYRNAVFDSSQFPTHNDLLKQEYDALR